MTPTRRCATTTRRCRIASSRRLRAPIEQLAKKGSYRGDRIKDYLPPELAGPGFVAPPHRRWAGAEARRRARVGCAAEARRCGEERCSERRAQAAMPPPVQRPSAATPPVATPPSAMLGALPPGIAVGAAEAPKAGELLVIAKTGRVPFKIPRRIPIGAAIGLAGAYVTGDTTLLEYGMFKVVTYPELVPHRTIFDSAEVKLDGHDVELDLATETHRRDRARVRRHQAEDHRRGDHPHDRARGRGRGGSRGRQPGEGRRAASSAFSPPRRSRARWSRSIGPTRAAGPRCPRASGSRARPCRRASTS